MKDHVQVCLCLVIVSWLYWNCCVHSTGSSDKSVGLPTLPLAERRKLLINRLQARLSVDKRAASEGDRVTDLVRYWYPEMPCSQVS